MKSTDGLDVVNGARRNTDSARRDNNRRAIQSGKVDCLVLKRVVVIRAGAVDKTALRTTGVALLISMGER
jgi:hypothetical protein